MAGKAKAKAEDKGDGKKKQGRAIILPNGQRRVDYIQDQYYKQGKSRSEIAKALTEMCNKTVPYQIVFAATKEDKDEWEKKQKEKAKKAA